MSQLGKTMLRVGLGELAVLMVPLVASQVVEGWNWDAGGFVFVYVLFFGTGMVYAAMGIELRTHGHQFSLRGACIRAHRSQGGARVPEELLAGASGGSFWRHSSASVH